MSSVTITRDGLLRVLRVPPTKEVLGMHEDDAFDYALKIANSADE